MQSPLQSYNGRNGEQSHHRSAAPEAGCTGRLTFELESARGPPTWGGFASTHPPTPSRQPQSFPTASVMHPRGADTRESHVGTDMGILADLSGCLSHLGSTMCCGCPCGYIPVAPLTYSLTHLLTIFALTHSLTYLLTHVRTHAPMYARTHVCTHSRTQSSTQHATTYSASRVRRHERPRRRTRCTSPRCRSPDLTPCQPPSLPACLHACSTYPRINNIPRTSAVTATPYRTTREQKNTTRLTDSRGYGATASSHTHTYTHAHTHAHTRTHATK
eukprot:GHVU01191937.1.p1 GENE.GHVU01191937.1~~GHVU01191937.1.p1  ORF type:complete len:274 (+),score=-10.72 GHVU01191937.1:362-1183(+)